MTAPWTAGRNDVDRDLDAARSGDRSAFDRLVVSRQRELLAHCYRMLGSAHDADDALQETLLRAWRALPGLAEGSSLRAWLYKIATNVCLAQIERRGRYPLLVADPAERQTVETDPPWLEPFPYGVDGSPSMSVESLESIELAFITAVQHLSPNQRVVLLLRDVLGFSARESAALLETTVPSVTSSLQRARKRVRELGPERSQQGELRDLGNDGVRALVAAYVDAWERSDAGALVALLARDATFSMPPSPECYRGREAIKAFLQDSPLRHRWRVTPVTANGQLAFACYVREQGAWAPHSLEVVAVRDGAIARITAFNDADLLLPLALPVPKH